MKYGVCFLSNIPCRKGPSNKDEMISQILFGETVKVYEERKKSEWIRVKSSIDNYESWISKKQIKYIDKETYELIEKNAHSLCSELIHVVEHQNVYSSIVLGSSLPFYKDGKCLIAEDNYTINGDTLIPNKKSNKSQIVEHAFMYINAPYLWGGRSPFGIDCSGLSQMVYKLQGINIPRDAWQQAEIGETLSFIEEAEPGDLAFFDNDEGNIIHVGILLSNNEIIHASSRVRIDKIDHQGIFNKEENTYSHRLRLIKKIC